MKIKIKLASLSLYTIYIKKLLKNTDVRFGIKTKEEEKEKEKVAEWINETTKGYVIYYFSIKSFLQTLNVI